MMKLVWSRSMWALIEPRCFNNFGWVRNQTLVTLSSFNQKRLFYFIKTCKLEYTALPGDFSNCLNIWFTIWVKLRNCWFVSNILTDINRNNWNQELWKKDDKRHLVNMTQNEFNIFKIFKKLLRTRYQAWIFPGRTRSSKRTWSTIYVKNL